MIEAGLAGSTCARAPTLLGSLSLSLSPMPEPPRVAMRRDIAQPRQAVMERRSRREARVCRGSLGVKQVASTGWCGAWAQNA